MLDPISMLVSVMVSIVGFALFVFGKKQERFPQLAVGVTMMIYPYFVNAPIVSLGIAACLIGLMVVAIRAGA